MADAAVEVLLNNLKDLLLYHSHLITGTKTQIQALERDLRLFNAFLKDSQQKRRKDETTKAMVRNIRDVVYEVEDVIDAFVTQALEKKSTFSFFSFCKSSVNLHDIGLKVEKVETKVKQAKVDFANLSVHDEEKYAKPPEVRPPRQKGVVGFKDVTEELINRLTKETDYFDVVCLIGMFGLGKTTLAWKIFNDPHILSQFPVRIWLPISQEFSNKDIFLAILKEFTTITDYIRQTDEMAIARMASNHLENETFLLVMDDVWSKSAWDRLKNALPNHNNKGKVLITSRNEDVGKYACNPRPPNKLRLFTQDESWELLRLEALHELERPDQLMDAGQLIAQNCQGLPLALAIIGGILATKYREADLDATRKAWEKVSTHVSTYLNVDSEDRMNNFISLSYDELPYHLRACFLYLGMFPEDYEIPASKLILMWIGEGFVQQVKDYCLEETGEMYLDDLISRNLVKVEKFKPNGKVKTCRIHDTLRDFCRTEAGDKKENFFQEIKSNNGGFSPPVHDLQKYRRLSIHSDCLNFISSKLFSPSVRSFVCFSKDEFILPLENISDILKALKVLRVLDVKPLKFAKVNKELFQLVHVRYIALSFNSSTLPSNFSKLWNLQTLIIETTSKTLDVKVDIWKLIQLRHFKTNASASLPKPSQNSKSGTELQTLSTISVENCTTGLFQQPSKLKKLGIRGHLALLLNEKKGSFSSLGEARSLENLKLINDLHSRPPSVGKLKGLPQPYQFPPRLKILTLRATFLDWSNMSVLGLLANLEVLKLKDKAFMGDTWETKSGDFRRLEFLHIEETDLAIWTASSHHYPRLRGLVLRNCVKLLGVPVDLAKTDSFKMLELYTCKSAVDSARKIQEAKKTAKLHFKLTIFPPTD